MYLSSCIIRLQGHHPLTNQIDGTADTVVTWMMIAETHTIVACHTPYHWTYYGFGQLLHAYWPLDLPHEPLQAYWAYPSLVPRPILVSYPGHVTWVRELLAYRLPTNVNSSPVGWIMKIQVSDASEYEQLLSPKEYEEHLSESIWTVYALWSVICTPYTYYICSDYILATPLLWRFGRIWLVGSVTATTESNKHVIEGGCPASGIARRLVSYCA